MTREVKDEICEKITKTGYKIIGGCDTFELMEKMIKVWYVYFEDKITFLLNIPMESHRMIDNYKLYKLYSLPNKVNKSSFLKIVIDEQDSVQTVGKKYRINVDRNKCFAKFE